MRDVVRLWWHFLKFQARMLYLDVWGLLAGYPNRFWP